MTPNVLISSVHRLSVFVHTKYSLFLKLVLGSVIYSKCHQNVMVQFSKTVVWAQFLISHAQRLKQDFTVLCRIVLWRFTFYSLDFWIDGGKEGFMNRINFLVLNLKRYWFCASFFQTDVWCEESTITKTTIKATAQVSQCSGKISWRWQATRCNISQPNIRMREHNMIQNMNQNKDEQISPGYARSMLARLQH